MQNQNAVVLTPTEILTQYREFIANKNTLLETMSEETYNAKLQGMWILMRDNKLHNWQKDKLN